MDIERRRCMTDFEKADMLMQSSGESYGCRVHAIPSNGGELYMHPRDADPATLRILTLLLGDRVTLVFDGNGRLEALRRSDPLPPPPPMPFYSERDLRGLP
jgi:hypothetical protein